LPERRPAARKGGPDAVHKFRRRLDPEVRLPELRAHLAVLRVDLLALLAASKVALEFERFG